MTPHCVVGFILLYDAYLPLHRLSHYEVHMNTLKDSEYVNHETINLRIHAQNTIFIKYRDMSFQNPICSAIKAIPNNANNTRFCAPITYINTVILMQYVKKTHHKLF